MQLYLCKFRYVSNSNCYREKSKRSRCIISVPCKMNYSIYKNKLIQENINIYTVRLRFQRSENTKGLAALCFYFSYENDVFKKTLNYTTSCVPRPTLYQRKTKEDIDCLFVYLQFPIILWTIYTPKCTLDNPDQNKILGVYVPKAPSIDFNQATPLTGKVISRGVIVIAIVLYCCYLGS
jgi:hypothetical protein